VHAADEDRGDGYGAGGSRFPEQRQRAARDLGRSIRRGGGATVTVLEANIDDLSPQVLAYAMERLLEPGALDVTLQPLEMKKGRPGTLLRVLARPEDRERMAQIDFAETSTLGLRTYTAERRVQARHWVDVETPHGKVRMKVSGEGAYAPEYEDCRAIARESGVPLKQ
jgi:pyridinium-3,5-bisthiocarboxylic acid mononucleotide nickel chelatase